MLCADDGVTALSVSSTAEALELTNELQCSGAGDFEVEWSGEVVVTKTLAVSNGTSLKVTGSIFDGAVMDGGGAIQLFVVARTG